MSGCETDLDLLERIRSGDRSACDDCIRRHANGVYRLALRLTRNEAEAEDVMQETFLSAFKAIHQFNGRSTLRTWLYRIAYNAALMRLRGPRHESLSLDEAFGPDDGTPLPRQLFDWTRLPEKELEQAELRSEMEKAIRELPELFRPVFVMRELEGLSTEETATALGLTSEAVKTRLHRARLWLRERLSAFFSSHATQR